MRDVGADKEAVGVHLRNDVRSTALLGERFTYSLEGTGKEVRVCALAEQRANLFVIKAADYFDIIEIGIRGSGGGYEGFNGGETTKFVIDTASEYEFFL